MEGAILPMKSFKKEREGGEPLGYLFRIDSKHLEDLVPQFM